MCLVFRYTEAVTRERGGTKMGISNSKVTWLRHGRVVVLAVGALAIVSLCRVAPAGAGTSRISMSSAGAEDNGSSDSPAISAIGRFVAFESDASNLVGGDTNGLRDIFVRDRSTGKTTLVSRSSAGAQGNGNSYSPVISADGRFVTFTSDASNLVGGDTNGISDIFIRGPLW